MIAPNADPSFKVAAIGRSLRLLDLPDEILLNVMSVLDLATLLGVKLVCRHFEDLADQFVYENAQVLRGDQAERLAEALEKNSLRHNWIKTLLVSTKFGEDDGLTRLPQCMEQMRNLELLRLETPDCNNRQPEERVNWIRLQDMYESIFKQSSLLVSNSAERKLCHLRGCTLHFVDHNVELYSLTHYASIFLHPSLRSLTLSCTSTDLPDRLRESLGNPKGLERSTDLEHLFLEECDIHAPSLAYLLSFPRCLKSFRFSEGVRYDGIFRTGSRRMHGNIKPHHLMDALTEGCSASLESLALNLGYRRHHSQNITDPGQYLNITRMSKLKSLEVDNITLQLIRPRPNCDHQTWLRLPASLEVFKVSNISLSIPLPFETRREPYIPLETCIVRDKAKHGVPNLATVIFSYDFTGDEDEYNELDDLLLAANFVLPAANNGNAGVNLPATVGGIPNLLQIPIHPPQPPAANGHLPAHITTNLNAVNPGNLNQAQQFLRQHWFTHANRARYPTQRSQREFTHLETSKIALLHILNNELLPEYRQHHTALIVDMVKLPRGFIPPYLYPEDKPTTHHAWWSSDSARETEAYKREFRHAREVRVFEHNMREERERRRREEELHELRRRIGRGEDMGYTPLPGTLTAEQERIWRSTAFGGADDSESDGDDIDDNEDDNNNGNNDNSTVGDSDSEYVDDDDDDDDDDDEGGDIPSFINDIPLFNTHGDIVFAGRTHDAESVDEDEDEEMQDVRTTTTATGTSSTRATIDTENEGDGHFVDAPLEWEGTFRS